MSKPVPVASAPRTEFTLRGIVLGIVITLAFTAANVFFGLKAGLTFATSIPAAVISMALLRGFRDSTIQENNIVQTVASAAGTLSSIIFVLPGLVIIGWWTGFPYWASFAICAPVSYTHLDVYKRQALARSGPAAPCHGNQRRRRATA